MSDSGSDLQYFLGDEVADSDIMAITLSIPGFNFTDCFETVLQTLGEYTPLSRLEYTILEDGANITANFSLSRSCYPQKGNYNCTF
jgi:hypothetical protein